MTAPRVWAPLAGRVEFAASGRRVAMRQVGGGWWEGPADGLQSGLDYGFAIDGGQVLPDPRSPWQPAGVHGLSRWLDHEAYEWHDDGWQPPAIESGVIYEMHVGTFTSEGTFEGAIGRLDELSDLGISHVELMPVVESPGTRGWGYDGVDLFAPHHIYGGPDGLKRLVDAAHTRGLAILLDVVYNHFGPDGNYLAQFGPYETDRHRTNWGNAVNLDGPGSDEVRRYLCDNALAWIRDYHVDGFRLDAVHALVDRSATHFLEQLAGEVDAIENELGRRVLLIAESNQNDPRLVQPRGTSGYGLDAQWSDDFCHALHVSLTGETAGISGDFSGLEDLCRALRDVFVYVGQLSAYRGRCYGRAVGDMPRSRFVGFLQNHDQTGHRAAGERSSHLMGPDALRVAAATVLLGPMVPLLFQGEEWGASTPFPFFADHNDPDLAAAVRDGRGREFGAFGWSADEVPDPGALETFTGAKLDWSERSCSPHAELLDWHRRLVQARRSIAGLAAGPVAEVDCDVESHCLVVRRGGTVMASNLGFEPATVPIPGLGALRLELRSHPNAGLIDESVDLPPMSVVLLVPSPIAPEVTHRARTLAVD